MRPRRCNDPLASGDHSALLSAIVQKVVRVIYKAGGRRAMSLYFCAIAFQVEKASSPHPAVCCNLSGDAVSAPSTLHCPHTVSQPSMSYGQGCCHHDRAPGCVGLCTWLRPLPKLSSYLSSWS
jgi:hypothetical protein